MGGPGLPLVATLDEEEARVLLQQTGHEHRAAGFVAASLRRLATVPVVAGVLLLCGASLSLAVLPAPFSAPAPQLLPRRSLPALQVKEDFGEYGAQDLSSQYCGNSPELNDFASKRGMESAGWWFNWTDDFTYKPLMYKDFVPPDSYWGFHMHGSGAISLRVRGEGTMTLDFGNLLGTNGSKVSVFRNLELKATAGPSVISKTVDIPYSDSDSITIVQERTGIIVLNRVTFTCATTTLTTSPRPKSEAGDEDAPDNKIADATMRWRTEHAELQKAAAEAEKKQQEHYAAVKLKEAEEAVLKKDESEEQKLNTQAEEHHLSEREKADLRENDRLVKALKQIHVWDDGGQAEGVSEVVDDMVATSRNHSLTPEEKRFEGAKEEERLAKEIEDAARDSKQKKGSDQDLKEAEELEKAAQAEEERSRLALEEAKKISEQKERIERNETWAKQLMENARAQADRTQKELEVAEREEDIQSEESAKAAKQISDALTPSKKDAESEKEKEKALEKEKERDQAKEEEEEQKMAVLAHLQTTATTTTKPLPISLYCYALMLPFGYEPNLLAAQKQKKVGMFMCDEWTIFSNSTRLLDTGEPSPVEVELLDFSLAVPYGGKWHTALNTPVFNKIWRKVRDMRRYLEHDWVVKADPDTVWFPVRLIEVLREGLPGVDLQQQRRLQVAELVPEKRLLQELPRSDGCKHCSLPGREIDTCDQHVQWLQANKNMSCADALEQTARPAPVDCGCQCTRLEACDLSSDLDWRLDGRFIKGDYLSPESGKPAIYVNNCRFGLHGPIEVLSASAVTAYVEGLSKCGFLLAQPWGEDKYLDRCMLALGVTRVNVFGMLSEIACGEEPAPCGGADVAFHPFKKFDEYFACWAFANSFGHGPAGKDDGQDGQSFI
mmetsp:Transcript_69870/g.227374  ORF Transcript_69870/g.227374 Transcript_69870/m.227374 type:complete len:894 (+) Transcript_69870:150-2831(+)